MSGVSYCLYVLFHCCQHNFLGKMRLTLKAWLLLSAHYHYTFYVLQCLEPLHYCLRKKVISSSTEDNPSKRLTKYIKMYYFSYRITINLWKKLFGLHLWSRGHSSRLQIQRSGFYSQRYQIFWEAVVLKRGPLSLVTTTEELLGRKSRGSSLENREYGRRDPSCWPRGTFYQQKLELTSPTSGGGSVGLVRSRTQAKEFSLVLFL
jgi:hypothetical protein